MRIGELPFRICDRIITYLITFPLFVPLERRVEKVYILLMALVHSKDKFAVYLVYVETVGLFQIEKGMYKPDHCLEFMNSKRKAKLRAEHEPEIILYEAATRELKKLLKGNSVPAKKKTIAKIRELSARKNEEYEELSEIKKREKSLQEKEINVRSIYENRIDRMRQKRKNQELG